MDSVHDIENIEVSVILEEDKRDKKYCHVDKIPSDDVFHTDVKRV